VRAFVFDVLLITVFLVNPWVVFVGAQRVAMAPEITQTTRRASQAKLRQENHRRASRIWICLE